MSKFQRWRVLHLDLDEPLPDLPAEPGCGGFFLICWRKGEVLGHSEVPADWLPFSATAVGTLVSQAITPALGDRLFDRGFKGTLPFLPRQEREVEGPDYPELLAQTHPLAALDGRIAAAEWGGEPATPISVIICTRDRSEDLGRCLQSLLKCSPVPDEILVVDNAPRTDATQRVVAQFPTVRYVHEPRPGLSAARNAGIRHATGEVIAFTDDDVVVHPHWVARLSGAFTTPETLAVTGLVLPAELETESQWVFEKVFGGFSQGYRELVFDSVYFQRKRRWGVPVWRIGAGANMAFRRRAFEEVGLFDERLGAGVAGCSEDSELWYRLLARGWTCRYDPALVTLHYHRRSMDALDGQMYQYMRGHVTALLIQWQRHAHWGNIVRMLLNMPAYYAKRAALGMLLGPDTWHLTLGSELRGCISGLKFYLRNRRESPAELPAIASSPELLRQKDAPSRVG